MSNLVLVRHGQARPFEENSDRLTYLGVRQAHALGKYWAGRATRWDQVWSGTLERQRKTAVEVTSCYFEAGIEFPALQESEAFNEYAVPIPDAALHEVQVAPANQRNRIFQAVIETAMAEWMRTPEFTSFHERVTEGLKLLMQSAPPKSRIAVFTSGGPIGVSVQTVLRAPVEQAIEINWRIRNCSLTEFIFSGSRVSLDCFNATPHLDSDELQSFR